MKAHIFLFMKYKMASGAARAAVKENCITMGMAQQNISGVLRFETGKTADIGHIDRSYTYVGLNRPDTERNKRKSLLSIQYAHPHSHTHAIQMHKYRRLHTTHTHIYTHAQFLGVPVPLYTPISTPPNPRQMGTGLLWLIFVFLLYFQ